MSGQFADLLASRPVFRVSSRSELDAALRSIYGARQVGFGRSDKPVLAAAGRVMLPDGGLHFCRYDIATTVAFPEMEGYRQILCLGGVGRITVGAQSVDVGPGVSCLIPPQTHFIGEYSDDYSHLVLQLSPEALADKLEMMTGRRPTGSLGLPTMVAIPAGRLWRLKALALTLAGQFAEPIDEGDLAVAELSHALTSSFLRDSLEGLSMPPTLTGRSKAQFLADYIEANWQKPLTVEDIAEACRTSSRSVFARFKLERGASPAAYLRDVRLSHARDMLLAPGGGSVIDVALKCGFSSFGHFARRYREKYGELPSTTLTRRLPD